MNFFECAYRLNVSVGTVIGRSLAPKDAKQGLKTQKLENRMSFRLERSAMEESFLFVLLFMVPTRGYVEASSTRFARSE